MVASSEGVLHLRPVTFVYKEDAQHVKQYGLIAEEVALSTRSWSSGRPRARCSP